MNQNSCHFCGIWLSHVEHAIPLSVSYTCRERRRRRRRRPVKPVRKLWSFDEINRWLQTSPLPRSERPLLFIPCSRTTEWKYVFIRLIKVTASDSSLTLIAARLKRNMIQLGLASSRRGNNPWITNKVSRVARGSLESENLKKRHAKRRRDSLLSLQGRARNTPQWLKVLINGERSTLNNYFVETLDRGWGRHFSTISRGSFIVVDLHYLASIARLRH